MNRIAFVLALCVFSAGTASAQPALNGNYGSEGTGTVNGEPVTEVSRWTFTNNKLTGFSQIINWGGKLTSIAGQPENSNGASPVFCEMSLSGGPTTSQLTGGLSFNLEMSTDGCPYPHNASGQPQLTDETYFIISENSGNEFSYSENGDEVGHCSVPNCAGLPISIAGHGVKFANH
jgi:hypothetical protein